MNLPIYRSRRARVVLGSIGILVGLIGFGSVMMERRAAMRRQALISEQTKRSRESGPGISWEGRTFRAGDKVRIASWAGTFKPQETGFGEEVDADGQVGIMLRGEPRPGNPKEPIQIVRVRWLPQQWKVNGLEKRVPLPEFEATIHVSYLEVIQ